MKLRHAAALALVGWYLLMPSPSCAAGENSEAPSAHSDDSQLRDEIEHEWYVMCPPFTTKPLGVDLSAPFTQWGLATHWPNRDVCEKQRAGAAHSADQWATSEKENMRVAATALQHCRCFSSNDPRLDRKFVRKLKQFYLEQLYREGLLNEPSR